MVSVEEPWDGVDGSLPPVPPLGSVYGSVGRVMPPEPPDQVQPPLPGIVVMPPEPSVETLLRPLVPDAVCVEPEKPWPMAYPAPTPPTPATSAVAVTVASSRRVRCGRTGAGGGVWADGGGNGP